MEQKQYYLIYFSSAVKKLSEDELYALLKKARKNNTQTGVTGMLMYYDGSFAQVLEGEEVFVKKTFERIKYDTRHHNIFAMKDGFADKRTFADWSMAFYAVKNEDLEKEEGYKSLIYKSIFGDTQIDLTNPILVILNSFIESQPIYRRTMR